MKVLLLTALWAVCACAAPFAPARLAGWPSVPPLQGGGFFYSSHELPLSYLRTAGPTYGYGLRPHFNARPPLTITAFAPVPQPAYFTVPSTPEYYLATAPPRAPPSSQHYPDPAKSELIFPHFPGNTVNIPSGFPTLQEGIPTYPGGFPSYTGNPPSYSEEIPNFPDTSPTFPEGPLPSVPGPTGSPPSFAPPSSFPSADGADKGIQDEDTISVESA